MSGKKNLAEDLLNLEINTILVDGISSRKMPDPPEVLDEIAEKYELFLKKTLKKTKDAIRGDDPEQSGDRNNPSENSSKEKSKVAFKQLSKDADALIRLRDNAREEGLAFNLETSNILRRVDKNCKLLEVLLKGNDSLRFSAEELLIIRKIWEVGVERVLMQTVVQIDGDIVTRIQVGRETEKDKFLQEMHKDLVNLAIGNWHFMVQTLADMAKSTLKSIFRR
ncbi:MAG: hypothetical protein ACE5FY_06035 [Nitrospiria bacterium]